MNGRTDGGGRGGEGRRGRARGQADPSTTAAAAVAVPSLGPQETFFLPCSSVRSSVVLALLQADVDRIGGHTIGLIVEGEIHNDTAKYGFNDQQAQIPEDDRPKAAISRKPLFCSIYVVIVIKRIS